MPFRKAQTCAIHVSGGEFNVAANLADCFRLRTGIATAMVDYPIGDLIAERVRAMGVQPFYKRFKHDGVRGPNMATVYSDRGHGVRGAGRLLQPQQRSRGAAQAGRLRLDGDLRRRASAGSTAAASSRRCPRRPPELIIEGDAGGQGARRGRLVRPELPREALEGVRRRRDRARRVMLGRIVEHVDVLVGNEEDLQKGLGIAGPEVGAKSKLDPSAFFGMIDRVVEQLPADQGRGDDAARRAFDEPPHLERGRVDRRTVYTRPPASSTSTIASAAATASRRASSTAC